ncbi:transcription initiation factor TFIID subunit 7-like [Clavelina lepadiformis]|uniref:TAFII55 protein conserved region domain-containing protein n=1 Tax=Clavelina lepadiformis TaxID=159417 RepID=A0ABP0GBR4_CLALP
MEKDIFNKSYELENQFLLRLPKEQAEKLKEILLAGNLKDRLSIEMQADCRSGVVTLDKEAIPAKLQDLPCIIESLKTMDMKTFYKTSDICQLLVCASNEDSELPSDKVVSRDKKHLFPHGITPPLKNVRKRRFRKTARKKYIDSPDIEKEVKRLLKADMEAVNVHYEIINEEEKGGEKNKSEKDIDITDQDELHKIFQDLSSSESEKDDVNVDDLDVMKDFDSIEIPHSIKVVTDKQERARLEARLEQLQSELGELRKRRQRKEHLINGENIKNEMLKMRFQSELEELTIRISETRHEYAATLAMLGRTS